MAARRRIAVVAALGILLLGASGCLEVGETAEDEKPLTMAQLDTASMVIPRKEFCPEIPAKAVERAIKGSVDNAREWSNGQEGVTGDVAQEFGCEWKSADGFEARAWVYARPVTREYAAEVIEKTSGRTMCRAPKPPKFGDPTQLQVCDLGGSVLRVRHAGLFGDAFLACEVAEPTADFRQLRKRAAAWCVDVVTTLDTNS